ncbi:MAG: DUF3108 domain-containing protein [Halofilum sp. (in: g-proteobacteria)]
MSTESRSRPARGVLLALALWLASPPAPAGGNALPEPLSTFRAEYRVTNGSIQLGTTMISLQPDASGWHYRSVTEATGLASLFVSGQAIESTRLEPHDGRLRPLAYDHTEPDDEDNVRVAFDWEARMATVRDAEGTRTLDLDAGTMDGFAATLAMIQAVARGERDIRIATIDDDGDHETLVFRQAGRESVSVPFGTFDTVRVERERKGKSRETITWLAPELDWVAVRIEQRKDGDLNGRLELTDLTGEAAGGA